jgi:hypothetical protein
MHGSITRSKSCDNAGALGYRVFDLLLGVVNAFEKLEKRADIFYLRQGYSPVCGDSGGHLGATGVKAFTGVVVA